MTTRSIHPVLTSALIAIALSANSFVRTEENSTADLSFKIPPGQSVKYQWTTDSSTETSGKLQGEAFSMKRELTQIMTVLFNGLPRKGAGMRIGMRFANFAYNDKKSVGPDAGEIQASRGKVKVIQNGKAVVDSDNDIGLDDVKSIQQELKTIEEGEMVVAVEPNGKEVGDPSGELVVIDTIKATGVSGILRLLPGRDVKPGESWEDSQTIPAIATFKLAKPVVVRSTSTFAGWEIKDGRRLVRIDIKTLWDGTDLNGDNGEGLLVEISRVQGKGAGTCLFDPATGQFVDGFLEATSKYRIDGKKDGQAVGMDVVGKTKFSFKQVP